MIQGQKNPFPSPSAIGSLSGKLAVWLAFHLALPAAEPAKIPDKDRSWWSFQPVCRPAVPAAPGQGGGSNPIDSFIQAELAGKKLISNPPAARGVLIRRAYFDLIGLPPSPEEITAFERDPSPNAWPRLIDHLLALPQYGERQARHWLDVVRFAQSNGYERDGEKELAWRYRDYVVKAFNEDKPYNQFVREQLAGDELDEVTPDSIVATGFQRLGIWDDEPDNKIQAEFDELDDVLSTTSTAFLGLTIGCARCHDHKVDPIPQADYYQLMAFFRNLSLGGPAKLSADSPNYVSLNGHDLPGEWALAAKERGPVAPATHILLRGNPATPGREVQPAFLSVLNLPEPVLPAPRPEATTSGRRRALAEWIASPAHPLTARVMVNRLWQHHFGRGLVSTTSDFGRTGSRPTHPALLDWLAAEFMGNDWSMKKLHRTILLSTTWQQSSFTGNTAALAVDPDNNLLWRQNLRRLDAEALRDNILSISGTLNPKAGGRGFFPRLDGEVLAGQSRPGLDWEISPPEEVLRRSLYAYVRRTLPVPILDAFDYSNTTSPLSERPVTTVSTQALLLLNDAFIQEQAASLAGRLRRESGDGQRPISFTFGNIAPLIDRGFHLALGRRPTEKERLISYDFMERQRESFAALRTRLCFRPDVPVSLSDTYMKQLRPEDMIVGPRHHWSYYPGRWSASYEGIRTVERDRGPFVLLDGPDFLDGVLVMKVLPNAACESAGILFRGSAKDGLYQGYELALEPREGRILLRRHAEKSSTLAEIRTIIPPDQASRLKIAHSGARLQVWIGEMAEPCFDFTDPSPLTTPGRLGVRTWGTSLILDDLVVRPDGMPPVPVLDEKSGPPEQRALQAFCLLLLNLNATAYID